MRLGSGIGPLTSGFLFAGRTELVRRTGLPLHRYDPAVQTVRHQGVCIKQLCLLLIDVGLSRQAAQSLADAGVHRRLQTHAPVSVNYGRDREPDRRHALSVADELCRIGRHDFGRCRQRGLSLCSHHSQNFRELTGIVSAGVYGLSVRGVLCLECHGALF